jgi:6-phosphogluconolactonase
MQIELHDDSEAVAARGAAIVARAARDSVAARGRFIIAVSGGTTPWRMLRLLADEEVPWHQLHLVQVDERVAPDGDPDRNLTHLRAMLLEHARLREDQIHAMPVNEPDLAVAATLYSLTLRELAGPAPVLDLVHLGMGADGHTASLVPGDSALFVSGADVAPTGVYQGRRRLTLTFPILNRARSVLWLVTGESKAPMVPRLLAGDRSIPSGCVSRDRATLIVDRAAAAAMRPPP